ncbi:Hypothetical predicted protein [Scomber scombrus]
MRRFLGDSGRMQFLFISRCGGSVIRLPWRLPRYTLAYRPSDGKSAFFCDFSVSAVNPNPLSPPSNFGVLTEALGRFRARCLCRYAR